jgi:DNA-binding transcriptional LysR family regulator
LVQGGFGIATLPLAAAQPMEAAQGLRILNCTTQLPPLPVHASYRSDPATGMVDGVLKSALAFM